MKELLAAQQRLLSDDKKKASPSERMSIAEFRKLAAESQNTAEGQTEILDGVETTLKDEKVIQLSQQTEMAKARLAAEEFSETTHEDFEKLNATLEKGLLKKAPESNTAEIAKQIKKQTEVIGKALSREKAEAVTSLALSNKPAYGPLERMMMSLQGFRKGLTRENLTKSALEKVNVGGIFNKAIAKQEWIQSQRASGSELSRKELGAQFPEVNRLRKEMQAEKDKVESTRKLSGMSEKEFAKTKFGKASAEKSEKLARQYAAFDIRSNYLDTDDEESSTRVERETVKESVKTAQKEQTIKIEKQEKKAALAQKESKDVAKDRRESGAIEFSDENQLEASREVEKQTDLLAKIEENTRPQDAKDAKPKDGNEGMFGGFLAGISAFLTRGLMSAFKLLFNPRTILKVLGKVFVPAMLIGSLVNGIIDGFKAFVKTGSITEALIAGFGGILDFLTFGLIDAKTIKNFIGWITGFVDEYLIKPITDFINMIGDAFNTYILEPIENFFAPVTNFFKNIAASVLGFFENFEIPGISFKIPVIDKEVSFGPWYPFKSDTTEAEASKPSAATAAPTAAPSAPPATEAGAVYTKSANNAQSGVANQNGTPPVIVNAPVQSTNVNNNQNISMPKPTRNGDTGFNRYIRDNSVFV